MRPIALPFRLAALLLLLSVAAGCGRESFLGSRYDNFTAYYNTFYNAQKAYDRGHTSLQPQDTPVDRTTYLPIFPGVGGTSGAKDFDDAIKKSADVLREHPSSKWVDDAAMLIGKAYFYKNNFIGAQEKFREISELDTGLRDEARFWLARTYIASEAYAEAAAHIQASLARDDLRPRWAAMLHLAAGELHVQQRNFEAAAEALQQGLKTVRDDEVGARAQFLLGQVLETLQRYDEAVDAFEAVDDFKPRYELGYAAQVSAIRVAGLHGDADAALRSLRRMERDDKHLSHAAELAYLRGRIYQAHARADEALRTYEDLLYYGDVAPGAVSGPVHYALGTLYRDAFRDYVMAAAHFDTARTQLQSGGANARGGRQAQRKERAKTPEALADVADQANQFAGFAAVRNEIARMDSLLTLGQLSDEAFAERIMAMRRRLAEQLAQKQREAERQQTIERFAEAEGQTAGRGQTTENAAQSAQSDAGFLFHKDPIRMQEGRLSFFQVWGERPRVPNWRRREAITATASAAADPGEPGLLENLSGVPRETTLNTLPQLDYSDVPRDSVRQAAMRAARALARYELANVLFLSMNRPDTAAAWYRRVIEEDADQPVAQRAFYALAELQRTLGDETAARRLYQQVVRDYPDSDFAVQARQRLGLDAAAVRPDALTLARQRYDDVYALWQAQRYAEALDAFVELALRHPDQPTAPRALLAAGTAYLEWARADSLDLFAPLPLSLEDSLLAAGGLIQVTALERRPDSLGQPLPVPADSLAAPRRDTLDVVVAAPPPAPDSVRQVVSVEGLLMHLATRYEGTPHAARAARMRLALADQRPADAPPPAAPLAAQPDDAVRPAEGASAAPEDDRGLQRRLLAEERDAGEPAAGPPPSPVRGAERLEDDALARPEAVDPKAAERERLQQAYPDLFGEASVTREQGGWTLLVLTQSDAGLAASGRAELSGEGYRTGLLVHQQGAATRYQVVLGRFETEAAARRAQAFVSSRLPLPTEVLPLDAADAAAPEATPPPDTSAPDAPPEQTPALYGTEAPAPRPGHWTLLTAAFAERPGADAHRDLLGSMGFRAAVWPGAALGLDDAFVVVAGLFEAEAAAREALAAHVSFFGPDARVVAVAAAE